MDITIGNKYWVRTLTGNDYEVEAVSLAGNNIYGEMLVNCKRTDESDTRILWEFARHLYTKEV